MILTFQQAMEGFSTAVPTNLNRFVAVLPVANEISGVRISQRFSTYDLVHPSTHHQTPDPFCSSGTTGLCGLRIFLTIVAFVPANGVTANCSTFRCMIRDSSKSTIFKWLFQWCLTAIFGSAISMTQIRFSFHVPINMIRLRWRCR